MAQSRWKRRILYLITVGAIFGVLFLGLFLSTQTMPKFYRQAMSDPEVTPQVAEEVQEKTERLLRELQTSPKETTENQQIVETITEQQSNSWLAFKFPKQFPEAAEQGVSDLRIDLEPGLIQFGCRVAGQRFSGIVNIKAHAEIKSPDTLIIEVVSAQIGRIPLPVDSLIDEFEKTVAEQENSGKSLHWQPSPEDELVGTLTVTPQRPPDVYWQIIDIELLTDAVRITAEKAGSNSNTTESTQESSGAESKN